MISFSVHKCILMLAYVMGVHFKKDSFLRGREGDSFHLLVHFPNGYNNWGLNRLKPVVETPPNSV